MSSLFHRAICAHAELTEAEQRRQRIAAARALRLNRRAGTAAQRTAQRTRKRRQVRVRLIDLVEPLLIERVELVLRVALRRRAALQLVTVQSRRTSVRRRRAVHSVLLRAEVVVVIRTVLAV